MKKRVLVTGGLGFIFSHVSEYLAAEGYEVYIVDNLSTGSHPEILGNFPWSFFEMDCADPKVVELIKNINPHYIIHAAAISDVDESIRSPRKVLEQNNAATLNVFEAARELKDLEKLVYVSTDEVYGECETQKCEEDIIWPKNSYSVSKAFGTLLRISYENTYPELKDKTAETRFCNVFGPRQDERKILGALKNSMKTGKEIQVHNGGQGYREYIYVKNIPPIVEKIMLEGNRVYNITLNDGFTVSELVQRVEEITGHHFPIVQGNRPGMDLKYQMSNKRAVEDLGFAPEYSFEEGIKEYFL